VLGTGDIVAPAASIARLVPRVLGVAAVLAAVLASPAWASQPIGLNAVGPSLEVSRDGKRALVTFRKAGRVRHVLVLGAVDALPPREGVPQVRFRIDRSGGWGLYGHTVWRHFGNACRPYDGPPLAWKVAACTAPDGSYWALQAWQKYLPHRGYPPWRRDQTRWELHVSHWHGETATLEVWRDWAFGGQAHDLFGRLRYRGDPVYGFRSSRRGSPLDGYGRGLYIDTYDSAYGRGWKRETSILFRRPTGAFCFSFWPTNDVTLPGRPRRPAGKGKRYRITVDGPGVTPDVVWQGPGLHDYDPRNPADVEYERQMNALFDQVLAGDRFCATQH
jgi:hypothetical protein